MLGASEVAFRADAAVPHARFLGDHVYSVLLTAAGSGVSRYRDRQLTAWSGDRTEDADGFFVYLRDRDDGRFWAATLQPVTGEREGEIRAHHALGRVTLERRAHGIASRLEVCVAPDEGFEVRRLVLRNESGARRTIEVTTYAEVVLHHSAAHAAHPAFQKLFVQTEHDPEHDVLLVRRRPRSADERHPWLLHALVGPGESEHETDRVRFVGRGRTPAAPRALCTREPLSGTTGSVLDPVVAFRRTLVLEPHAEATLYAVLGAAPERGALRELAARLDTTALDDAFLRAAAREEELLAALGVDAARAEAWQDLLGRVLYDDPSLRADPEILRRAHDLAALNALGVARDAPYAVLTLGRTDDVATLRELLAAQAYWRAKGHAIALVVPCANAEIADAAQAALDEAARAASDGPASRWLAGAPAAACRLLRDSELTAQARDALLAAARLVLPRAAAAHARAQHDAGAQHGDVAPHAGTTSSTIRGADAGADADAYRAAAATPAPHDTTPRAPSAESPPADLQLASAYGGFSADGTEYVLRLAPGERPPMPWVNVVAHQRFGFLASESGAACTWSGNSRENRLTPWRNDPVVDPHDEALWVRDEDARTFWSPQPGPTPSGAPCEVRHGFGYTVWRQTAHELEHEVTAFVPRDEPVKLTRVRLTNLGARPRRLSVVSYARLVLGVLPEESGRLVVSELDAESGALLARSALRQDYGDAVAFAAAHVVEGRAQALHHTADRATFLGRNGSPAAPEALRRAATLDGASGVALDPCAAWQLVVEVAPGASVECVFLLGEAASVDAARALVRRYAARAAVEEALAGVRAFWRELTSSLRVATPCAALDVMVNGWLLYQTLSCRMWGRTAFYQSGGAYGFRDQLQDSAAFYLGRPEISRAQLLLHAAHQFVEGDVLHWWHPPASRGIRTRFADDLCWLPWLTATYVRATGDRAVLDERVSFVEARALAPGEEETYLEPTRSRESASLYEHCCRALDRGLTRGPHGLPLFGTGDWNDGMNRVGREGRGESVWMAFFLYRILEDFTPLCDARGDHERAARYREYQASLVPALEQHAWDGAWYRRAYYDDGTPLGSASNSECRIDALAQAWAALSGAVPRERAERALDAVEELLVDDAIGIIRLLAPPFDRDPHDPGYIKGYVPGIRENGGQYTHAALWVVQAMATLGRRARAVELLEKLTPVWHARDAAAVATYQVEPYVVAADIYGVAPHLGRGGWTWYTGSAGWMYRVAVESILGLRLEDGATLLVRPCVPDAWPRFSAELALDGGRARYAIEVVNERGDASRVVRAMVDGAPVDVLDGIARIPLARDGALHRVRVELGG
ncbi:MAG TPA: hypothetical protein VIS07_17515 [Candidatus Binatia bacterium]